MPTAEVEKAAKKKGVKKSPKLKAAKPSSPKLEVKQSPTLKAAKPWSPKQGAQKDPATKTSAGTKNKPENRVKKDPKEPRGVVYIGHLPNGFFEPQMRQFLQQFGTVTRLRLSRSKKNARSKGYAFVEFDDEDVAQIVADTMDKYLLFGRQLVAKILPAEKRHPALFRGAGKVMQPTDRKKRALQRLQHNKKRGDDSADADDKASSTPAVTSRQQSRRLKKEQRKRGVLAGMGIDYDFEGWLAAKKDSKKKKEKKKSGGAEPTAGSEKKAVGAKPAKVKADTPAAPNKEVFSSTGKKRKGLAEEEQKEPAAPAKKKAMKKAP